VGVDGSAASLNALQWALDYASATHSRIEVIAAWEWPTTLAWSGPFPSDFDPDMSAEQMLDRLMRQERADHPELVIDGQVVQGDPAKVLESASHGAALLVVAQRGHNELVGFLLGSVSKHCVTHAHCPVLVFRGDPCRGSTGANS
jgi:nucleotide-binding universal stress UspA family protein